ncbi:uncharacterized protein LOC127808581 [Diospyros lotus]|uniref:uncharacterized protein LOC127808581 n=1 Tax=Diospyros lotus TaxID=55363 RepID=UPI0022585A08|nr:uncharacterized protein LOC127808581 [Diospyros lotus]
MAEYWLEQSEKLLRHLQFNDEDKVNCVTFMLEEEVGKWWQTTEQALQRSCSRQGFEIDETPVSVWEAFNDKYFPLNWRQEKSWEFANLKQIEEMPALSTWSIESYEEALSKALTTERNLLQVKQIRSGETKRDSKQKSRNKNPQGSKQCFKCKKSHSRRKCLAGTSICYSCGKQGHNIRDFRKRKETPPVKDLSKVVCFQCNQPGHYSSNCPKRPRLEQIDGLTEKAGEAHGTCQGRVYNLTKEDVGTNPAVVQGMDFLSKYDASIDCRRKVMTIKEPEGEWVRFWGQGGPRNGKMISGRKAEKLISQGSHGCIAYARLEEKEVPKLKEVWIV